MNIKNLNGNMKATFHAAGYTGKDCVICVLDTAMGDVGKMKSRIEHADNYRVDDKNVSDHSSFVGNQLFEWAPDATILSYCVFPDGNGNLGYTNTALADVIQRAKADPSRHYFVNMSLACNIGRNAVTPGITRMHSLIKECNKVGVPVYVAAGNDGTEELYIYPSRFQEPVCIAAAKYNGARASFSVFHNEVDFLEHGVDIVGINRYGLPTSMSGTSMACPNALGKSVLLACKMAATTGTWPTEMQLYNEMKECAIDCETVGYDKKSGFGFVDITRSDGIFKSTNSVELPLGVADSVKRFRSIISNFLRIGKIVAGIQDADIKYSRLIKFGVAGDDVKKAKDKLVELGYLYKSTKYTFGYDSVRATKKFQADSGLKVDGIIGPITWNALFGEDQDSGSSSDSSGDSTQSGWTRALQVGMSGSDVKLAKDKLVELGYLHRSTHERFGNDTKASVMRFQLINGLTATGVIDLLTWNALFSATPKVPEEVDVSEIPANISRAKAQLIAAELKNVSAVRKAMVLDVLQYAVDPDNLPKYPRAFYIRGGNLVNKDLTLNVMTRSKLNAYLSNPNYEAYYNGGRDEMMREASESANYTLPGWDCSGEPVGLLRKHCVSTSIDGVKKAVSSGFDANANTLFASYCTETTNPKPGDMLHKSGHAGFYCGAGYCVEAVGGAYGVAISEVANRRVYSFINHKMHKMGDWEHFGKWVFLDD